MTIKTGKFYVFINKVINIYRKQGMTCVIRKMSSTKMAKTKFFEKSDASNTSENKPFQNAGI